LVFFVKRKGELILIFQISFIIAERKNKYMFVS